MVFRGLLVVIVLAMVSSVAGSEETASIANNFGASMRREVQAIKVAGDNCPAGQKWASGCRCDSDAACNSQCQSSHICDNNGYCECR